MSTRTHESSIPNAHVLMPRLSAIWMLLAWGVLLTGCRQPDVHGHNEAQPHDQHGIEEQDAAFTGLAIGSLAPRYTGKTPAGETVTVGPGQPMTLLNLWATWCAPCLEEFPDIEQIHQQLGPQGLRILAVNVDELDLDAIQSFASDLGVTFTVAIDEAGDLQDRYQVVGLPSSFLIKPDGTIAHIWTGRLPENAIEEVAAFLDI